MRFTIVPLTRDRVGFQFHQKTLELKLFVYQFGEQQIIKDIRWNVLVITQPMAIRGVVAKPYSPAPSVQAMAMSQPARI